MLYIMNRNLLPSLAADILPCADNPDTIYKL
jgi:hypothetical protein